MYRPSSAGSPSASDHFDYELSSPRDFDLMADISQCEELLNATSWTGESAYKQSNLCGKF